MYLMDVLQSVLSLVITLGILVTVHEYGHYLVARRCGVAVLRFSVGFGKPLFTWKNKNNTEFVIASIPLGGYVKMLDEREGPVEKSQLEFAFNRKPVSQRIAIASAGPIANFLFAIFAYWMMFVSGFNVLIPTVGNVETESVAYKAGLAAGYEITAVDGRETLGWRAVNMELINRIGDTGDIQLDATVAPGIAARSYSISIADWMVDSEPSSLIQNLGITPKKPVVEAVMGEVLKNSPAELGGLLADDKVIRANGMRVDDWFAFVDVIQGSPEKEILVDVLRLPVSENDYQNAAVVRLKLKPEIHTNEKGVSTGRLGVSVKPFKYSDDMIREVRYGPIESLSYASSQVWADSKMTFNAIIKMVQGLISLDNLSGPITIAQVASDSIRSGSEAFLRFLALLSVSLGILNLLPIPVLDGGHILYYSLEGLRGKPISEKWQLVGLKVGISFILVLMSLAFYNDVMRLL